ncbi:hypothetical protein AURDEDRAFT_170675 [Auricularia subglabra TFB-10046 SS5]|nr:hypothetical protein AURDEDRAFT_170675 [Auricularia subglabra TFB-10046 SS5]
MWLLLCFVALGAARTLPSTRPGCVHTLVPIRASAVNFDFSTFDPTIPVPPNQTLPVSGWFNVEAEFCKPTTRKTAHVNTLLVTSPGATYNSLYWDLPFKPENYSFARYANSRGFATLNIARVGNGFSSSPDPVNILQMPLQVAAQIEILKLARAGGIPGMRGQRFKNLVAIGHSLSGALINGIVIKEPKLLQGAIFTAYGHIVASPEVPRDITGFAFIPASDANIPRFRNLPADYVTTENITSRSFFYGPPGTFDPAVLEFDEAHKDTVTNGEMNTLFSVTLAAPQFRGDVLAVHGALDVGFCTVPACDELAQEHEFYPNARSMETVAIQGAGHNINFHLSAPVFFAKVASWLESRDF